MRLYLLRHGDAVLDPNVHDSERPLSQIGRQQARAAGSFLHLTRSPVDLILCSPLLRSRQTAEEVLEALGKRPLETTEYLVPESNQAHFFEFLDGRNVRNILLVGHEPNLSTAISLLVSGTSEARVAMKKASLAALEVDSPVQRGSGILLWLLTADQMMKTI